MFRDSALTRGRERLALPLLGAAFLAGCVAPSGQGPQVPSQSAAPTYTLQGLESVMGANARALAALLGEPGLDVRERDARKLQFLGPACILDAYLYPNRGGGEPIVTHVDARLPDGRDMDRASCVAALRAQQRSR